MSTTQSPSVPLIFTTLGNVPEESLDFSQQWEYAPGSHVKVTLTHQRDGIVVKQSVHVLSLRGVAGQPAAGGFAGPAQEVPSGCPAGF